MSNFQYRPRPAEQWQKRADQKGSQFIGYVKDQFTVFTPPEGDNWGRILPPSWDEPDHYGIEVWSHFGVGPLNANVLCPLRMDKQPCPVDEEREAGEKEGREDLDSLKPNKRVLVWWLDRKDENAGPQVWPMPWTLDRDIAILSLDPQSKELYQIDHPYNGFDIFFTRVGKDKQTKYTGLRIARKATSVDDRHLEFIKAHPLPSILIQRTYDEIKELFIGGKAQETRTASPRNVIVQSKSSEEFCDSVIKFQGKRMGCDLPPNHGGQECNYARLLPDILSSTTQTIQPPSDLFAPEESRGEVDQEPTGATRSSNLRGRFNFNK